MSSKPSFRAVAYQLATAALAIYWFSIGDNVLASIWAAASVVIMTLRTRP